MLIGATLLAVTLGAWWLDSSESGQPAWALMTLGVVATLGALRELLVMGGSERRKRHVGMAAGVAWIAVLGLSGLGAEVPDGWPAWLTIPIDISIVLGDVFTAASAVAAVTIAVKLRHGPHPAVVELARSLWFCVPYVGGLACLVALLAGGRLELVIGAVLVSKSSDIGAYFVGKRFGRRKLSPRVSPNKTVEGLVGGLILPAIVASFLLEGVVLGGPPDSPLIVPGGALGAAVHGLVLGLLTVISDLSESLIKRSCDVKDSGTLFGESGGFFDVVDSLLLVAPILLAYTALAS